MDCTSCDHFNDIAKFCKRLKERISVSRNPLHPGLHFRPSACARLQYYRRKPLPTPDMTFMTGLGWDDDPDDD